MALKVDKSSSAQNLQTISPLLVWCASIRLNLVLLHTLKMLMECAEILNYIDLIFLNELFAKFSLLDVRKKRNFALCRTSGVVT